MNTTKRILYAEQDEDTADAVRYILKGQGYDVTTRNEWGETLKILQEEVFDLVLLDMLLPERPGKYAYSQIREHHEGHVALVTLFPISDRRQKYLESQGIAGVFRKPFSKQDLVFNISRILEEKD